MQNPRRGIVLTPEDFRGVDWIKRSSELGLNTLGLHNGEGIGNNTISRLEMATTSDFQKSATKAGLDYEYELHTMATLLPRELFDAHPEYFVYDEQRKARIPNYNFCPTNGDALEIVTKNAVRCAEILRPTTHRYFFWSDDNMPWCSCKTCKELSSSEQELLVANRICEALRKSCDPLAQVAFLAYHRTLDTPQNIKPSPGGLSRIRADRQKPRLANCRPEQRSQPPALGNLAEAARAFPRRTNTRIGILVGQLSGKPVEEAG